MAKKSERKDPGNIKVESYLRCQRIYPTEACGKSIADLKTVGFKLTRDQAIHLARVILAASGGWEEMEITAFRSRKRKSDGTYQITVTSAVKQKVSE